VTAENQTSYSALTSDADLPFWDTNAPSPLGSNPVQTKLTQRS